MFVAEKMDLNLDCPLTTFFFLIYFNFMKTKLYFISYFQYSWYFFNNINMTFCCCLGDFFNIKFKLQFIWCYKSIALWKSILWIQYHLTDTNFCAIHGQRLTTNLNVQSHFFQKAFLQTFVRPQNQITEKVEFSLVSS